MSAQGIIAETYGADLLEYGRGVLLLEGYQVANVEDASWLLLTPEWADIDFMTRMRLTLSNDDVWSDIDKLGLFVLVDGALAGPVICLGSDASIPTDRVSTLRKTLSHEGVFDEVGDCAPRRELPQAAQLVVDILNDTRSAVSRQPLTERRNRVTFGLAAIGLPEGAVINWSIEANEAYRDSDENMCSVNYAIVGSEVTPAWRAEAINSEGIPLALEVTSGREFTLDVPIGEIHRVLIEDDDRVYYSARGRWTVLSTCPDAAIPIMAVADYDLDSPEFKNFTDQYLRAQTRGLSANSLELFIGPRGNDEPIQFAQLSFNNNLGFIDLDRSPSDTSCRRVVFAGGSYTQQQHLSISDGWVRIAEERARINLQECVEFINMSEVRGLVPQGVIKFVQSNFEGVEALFLQTDAYKLPPIVQLYACVFQGYDPENFPNELINIQDGKLEVIPAAERRVARDSRSDERCQPNDRFINPGEESETDEGSPLLDAVSELRNFLADEYGVRTFFYYPRTHACFEPDRCSASDEDHFVSRLEAELGDDVVMAMSPFGSCIHNEEFPKFFWLGDCHPNRAGSFRYGEMVGDWVARALSAKTE